MCQSPIIELSCDRLRLYHLSICRHVYCSASVHYLSLFSLSKPAALILALNFPNMAGKALSTMEFCCGVPEAVYSKSIPISSSIHCLLRMLFSPALSLRMCLIFFLYVSHNSFKSGINLSFVSDFFSRRN